jgi:hypothetical protein
LVPRVVVLDASARVFGLFHMLLNFWGFFIADIILHDILALHLVA